MFAKQIRGNTNSFSFLRFMIQHSRNFIKSKIRLVVISRRICDTNKSEVQYRAQDENGKEIRGSRIYDRKTPMSYLLDTIHSDLQCILN